MHRLLERVEGQQLEPGLDRRLVGPRPALVGEEPRQGVRSELPQPLPLRHQPLLEEGPLEGEALQEVPPVEGNRLRQTPPGRLAWTSRSKSPSVYVDGLGVEGEGRAAEIQAGRVGRRQGSAEDEEGLAEATPCLMR